VKLCASVDCPRRVRALGVRALGLIVLGASLGTSASGATRTDLDADWQFRADPDRSGEAKGWTSAIPPDTESVRVPHTWNIGRLHDYRGVAW